MASGSVWGIDIGKSSLKAARMRGGKEGVEVQALFYEEYQPADDGTIPASESSRVLEALIAKHPEMKKDRVYVALPGQQSFARFIKLTAMDPRKIAEMVRFEAQQQIPFPVADVNWDYSIVDRDYEDDEEREVGLFAIKKDLVYAFLADLQLSGLEPHAITTGPLAIYNFVRWDMELPEDQATVVLDIGWSNTDLVIVDGSRYWVRNLALNGQELTKAIAAKLKVPFKDAEEKKRAAADSPENRKIYQATELVLKDFVAEIQRSIAFYKAQNKDRQITIGQVLLLGNATKLPNVRPFFQKELGLPVETVKRLSNLALDVEIDNDEVELLKEHLPSFAVAFGLGIQGCGEGLNEVNLLPEEIRQRQALEKKKIPVLAAVAILWVTVVCAYFAASGSLDKVKGVQTLAARNLTALEADQSKIDAARAPIKDLEAEVEKLTKITAKRNYAIEVFNKLAPVLPKKNDDIVAPTPAQMKLLAQGKKKPGVDQAVREMQAEQDKRNEDKTWVLEIGMKPAEDDRGRPTGLRTSLLVARKYVRNAAGGEDEAATKRLLETGILADVKQAFPNARFEGAPKKIYNLDKDQTTLPQGAPGGFGPPPAFCGLTIAFDYPIEASSVAERPAPPAPTEKKE